MTRARDEIRERLRRNGRLAAAELARTPLWRGQRRSGGVETRLPSIAFGTREAATIYAENPNDRTFAETETSPFVAPAVLEPRRAVFAPFPPGEGDPFLDMDVVDLVLGPDAVARMTRDLSAAMSETAAWEGIVAETGFSDPAEALLAWGGDPSRMPPVLTHEALRLPWFVSALVRVGYDAVLTGGCGANALEDEWHALDPEIVRTGFAAVRDVSRRRDATLAAFAAVRDGEELGDPFGFCPELEFFEDETDPPGGWRAARIPVAAILRRGDHPGMVLDGETPAEAATRWGMVEEWMRASRGPGPALEESPVILRLDEAGLTIIDGWHRCVTARDVFGEDEVRALVRVEAWPPGAEPETDGPSP